MCTFPTIIALQSRMFWQSYPCIASGLTSFQTQRHQTRHYASKAAA